MNSTNKKKKMPTKKRFLPNRKRSFFRVINIRVSTGIVSRFQSVSLLKEQKLLLFEDVAQEFTNYLLAE